MDQQAGFADGGNIVSGINSRCVVNISIVDLAAIPHCPKVTQFDDVPIAAVAVRIETFDWYVDDEHKATNVNVKIGSQAIVAIPIQAVNAALSAYVKNGGATNLSTIVRDDSEWQRGFRDGACSVVRNITESVHAN